MKTAQFLSIVLILLLITNNILFGAEVPAEPPNKLPKASENVPEGDLKQPASGLDPDNRNKRSEKKKKIRRRTRRRCQSSVSSSYRKMLSRWRSTPKIPKIQYRNGLRDLALYAVNTGERVRFFPYLPDGELDPEVLPLLGRFFRDKHTDAEHAVEPRLIKLLYKIADRFKARQINVISGYREVVEETNESNHSRGLALDIMIPGTKLGAAAYYARTLGHVGVGFYPTSGFIHLDVRTGPSFFWVDRSGPGKPSCLVRVHSEFAAKMDRRWKPKSDVPRRHKNKRGRLLGAVETKKVL
jgi:uncharacterized protein YcbK (DUF882 family)